MKNTRTFTDLDLNFLPAPSSQDRYSGIGTISFSNVTTTVTGTNTNFLSLLEVNDNLYDNSKFIGKIKSISSDTSLELYEIGIIPKGVTEYIITVLENSITRYAQTYNSALSSSLGHPTFKLQNIISFDSSVNENSILFNLPTYISIEDDKLYDTQLESYILDETASTGNVIGNLLISDDMTDINVTVSKTNNIISQDLIIELKQSSLYMIENAYTYSNPADISLKTDANAIKASIKHLILTMNHERPFNSKIGSQTKAIMFEPASPMMEILLRRSIEDTIQSFEPRVNILDIVINIDIENYNVNISIYFQIVNTTQPLRIDLVLERTR